MDCDSVVFSNAIYRRDTVFTDTFQNAVGCDSIVPISIDIIRSANERISVS